MDYQRNRDLISAERETEELADRMDAQIQDESFLTRTMPHGVLRVSFLSDEKNPEVTFLAYHISPNKYDISLDQQDSENDLVEKEDVSGEEVFDIVLALYANWKTNAGLSVNECIQSIRSVRQQIIKEQVQEPMAMTLKERLMKSAGIKSQITEVKHSKETDVQRLCELAGVMPKSIAEKKKAMAPSKSFQLPPQKEVTPSNHDVSEEWYHPDADADDDDKRQIPNAEKKLGLAAPTKLGQNPPSTDNTAPAAPTNASGMEMKKRTPEELRSYLLAKLAQLKNKQHGGVDEDISGDEEPKNPGHIDPETGIWVADWIKNKEKAVPELPPQPKSTNPQVGIAYDPATLKHDPETGEIFGTNESEINESGDENPYVNPEYNLNPWLAQRHTEEADEAEKKLKALGDEYLGLNNDDDEQSLTAESEGDSGYRLTQRPEVNQHHSNQTGGKFGRKGVLPVPMNRFAHGHPDYVRFFQDKGSARVGNGPIDPRTNPKESVDESEETKAKARLKRLAGITDKPSKSPLNKEKGADVPSKTPIDIKKPEKSNGYTLSQRLEPSQDEPIAEGDEPQASGFDDKPMNRKTRRDMSKTLQSPPTPAELAHQERTKMSAEKVLQKSDPNYAIKKGMRDKETSRKSFLDTLRGNPDKIDEANGTADKKQLASLLSNLQMQKYGRTYFKGSNLNPDDKSYDAAAHKAHPLYKKPEQKVDEETGTGAVAGYSTPGAFSRPGQKTNRGVEQSRREGYTVCPIKEDVLKKTVAKLAEKELRKSNLL